MMVSKSIAYAGIAVLGLATLVGFTLSRADAQDSLDTEAIEQIVHDYLLANPEVIIDAVRIYSERQDQASLAAAEDEIRANLPTLLSGSTGHAMGADQADAEVLVVEFFDYHCGYCRDVTDFVMGLPEQDDVRLVLQELPVVHPMSRNVSNASLLIEGQDDYRAFHIALMNSSGIITPERLPVIAAEAGIDFGLIESQLADDAQLERVNAKIELSIELARSMGISSTPNFIVATPDGEFVRLIPGADEARVREAIEEARAFSTNG